MYLDCTIKIPDSNGKITKKTIKGTTYIYYEYARIYLKDKKYNTPRRICIGKQIPGQPALMLPNDKFLKIFPQEILPEEKQGYRSGCLRIGAYIVIRKVISDYRLDLMLARIVGKDAGLFLDLAAYTIITEGNAAQYYPDYAFNHPLMTEDMRIYSDSKVSDFLSRTTTDQRILFLNEWNEKKDHRERIYISYDSTNKNCQSGDIDIAEYGHAKDDIGAPVFNYSVAFDTENKEPLFYEQYPGSINDISQLTCMIDKAYGYGYRNLGFILDRGYFSRKNLSYIDQHGYSFLIMVKGMKDLVRSAVLDYRGTFESSRAKYIEQYDLYGITMETKLFDNEEKRRHLHIYYSDGRAYSEKQELKQKIKRLKGYLNACVGKRCNPFGPEIERYFYLHYEKDGVTLKLAEENASEIEKELCLAGYFAIVSSDKMTARKAICLYKSRDASEKLFRADKSYLGNKSMRIATDEALSAKVFIQFIALILRNNFFACLSDKRERMLKSPNYMTVPAAMKELEKIVMIRQLDGVYRLDHAVTATQKTILDAFGLDDSYVRCQAKEIEKALKTNN